ncbi:hypothetical protein WR25_14196 [Diploscapter pachys]|uniref:Uncharacterized protein n=1 Tax=Diploscapter pachys TaxID=2018661 RepID=A0A2A2LZ15_9BILA|nr:hypothetical protein WR25_14196 [Diploscapter pachys]
MASLSSAEDASVTTAVMESSHREASREHSGEVATGHLEKAAHLMQQRQMRQRRSRSTSNGRASMKRSSAESVRSTTMARSVGVHSYLEAISPRLRTSSQSLNIGGYPVLEIALMTAIVAVNAAYYAAQAFMYAGEAIGAFLVGVFAIACFTYQKPQVAADLVKTTYHLLKVSYDNDLLSGQEIYNIVTHSLLNPMTNRQIEKEYKQHAHTLTFEEYAYSKAKMNAKSSTTGSARTYHTAKYSSNSYKPSAEPF